MADDLNLIAAIYDAAIDPVSWEEVLKRMVDASKSIAGAIVTNEVDAGHITALCNVDSVWAAAYSQTYYKINPLVVAAMTLAPGRGAGRRVHHADR